MQLWIGGELQEDIADDYRKVGNMVEDNVNEVLSKKDYGQGVIKWAFIAMIFGEDGGPAWYKEVKRYNKRSKVGEFRLRIDHDEFKTGDLGKKTALLCQALLRSLTLLEEMRIDGLDVHQLRGDFLSVVTSHGWLA